MIIQVCANQKQAEPVEKMIAQCQQMSELGENQEKSIKQEAPQAKKKVKKSLKSPGSFLEIRCQSIPTAR